MEVVIGLLFALLLCCILLLPVFMFLGFIGLTLQAVWAVFVFVLKYGAFAAVIGAIVAIVRSKKRYFEAKDYFIHAGVAAAISLAIMCVWLRLPVSPDFPTADEVVSLTAAYALADGSYEEQEAWKESQINRFCEDLQDLELHRSLKEFVTDPEDGTPYEAFVVCDDGSQIHYTFYSEETMRIGDGISSRYYKIKEDTSSVPRENLNNIFLDVKRDAVYAIWAPFAEEFFDSIHYDSEDGMVYFCIPGEIPDGTYSIVTNITAVEFLEGGKENKYKLTPFQEQQNKSTWEPGAWYSFPLPEGKYITFDFEVRSTYGASFTFDLMSQIPMEYHRYPW